MIPGFNHNIKHKGRIFHVQTEDSGPKNPHIITHLFVGGNILASKKTSYVDLVGQPDWEKTLRTMMEEQHKAMLRNLVNGAYDSVQTGQAYHLDGPAPLNVSGTTSPATALMAGATAFKGLPSEVARGAQPSSSTSATSTPASTSTPTPTPALTSTNVSSSTVVAPASLATASPSASFASPLAAPSHAAPPTTVPTAAPVPAPPAMRPAATSPAATSPAAPVVAPAAARAPTIFGEDLISEKSLDEVILSYLAEDVADVD